MLFVCLVSLLELVWFFLIFLENAAFNFFFFFSSLYTSIEICALQTVVLAVLQRADHRLEKVNKS